MWFFAEIFPNPKNDTKKVGKQKLPDLFTFQSLILYLLYVTKSSGVFDLQT